MNKTNDEQETWLELFYEKKSAGKLLVSAQFTWPGTETAAAIVQPKRQEVASGLTMPSYAASVPSGVVSNNRVAAQEAWDRIGVNAPGMY